MMALTPKEELDASKENRFIALLDATFSAMQTETQSSPVKQQSFTSKLSNQASQARFAMTNFRKRHEPKAFHRLAFGSLSRSAERSQTVVHLRGRRQSGLFYTSFPS